MGSGKTTVGSLLADRLGWEFDDSDAAITRDRGADVRVLNDRLGTERMHELEAEHLRTALRSGRSSVIAAAASVIDDPDCRAELERPEVVAVWLDIGVDALLGRFSERSHRPLLAADPQTMLERQRAERAPLFARVCGIHVLERARTAAQTAEEILAALPFEP